MVIEITAITGMITAICVVYKILSSRVDASVRYLNEKKLDKEVFDAVISRITSSMSKLEAHIEKIADKTDRQGEILAEIKAILDVIKDDKKGV